MRRGAETQIFWLRGGKHSGSEAVLCRSITLSHNFKHFHTNKHAAHDHNVLTIPQNDHPHPLLLVWQGKQGRSQNIACSPLILGTKVIADLYEKYVDLIGTSINDEGDTMPDGYVKLPHMTCKDVSPG